MIKNKTKQNEMQIGVKFIKQNNRTECKSMLGKLCFSRADELNKLVQCIQLHALASKLMK